MLAAQIFHLIGLIRKYFQAKDLQSERRIEDVGFPDSSMQKFAK